MKILCIFLTLFMSSFFTLSAHDDKASIKIIKTTNEKIEISQGEFDVTVSWLAIQTDFDYFEPLNGVVKFTPKENLGCENISVIQIAKVVDNSGNDYEWPLGEAPRNEMRTADGYFVDHEAWGCTNKPSQPCSPYYRDHWPNEEDGSQDGSSMVGEPVKPTILVDYPYGWEYISRINLEACAMCRATGESLWGGVWPVVGERDFDIKGSSEEPSETFYQALKLFTKYYER
jgi:hypothetical protein